MNRDEGNAQYDPNDQSFFASISEISETGHPDIQPDKVLVRFIDFRARRRGQKLHTHIRGTEQECAEHVDYNVQACADDFCAGTIALENIINIIVGAHFPLRTAVSVRLIKKGQDRSQGIGEEHSVPFRTPRPKRLSSLRVLGALDLKTVGVSHRLIENRNQKRCAE